MMNRATPITSALKRKYSPFKKEDSKAVKESKQKLADETGVYVQTKTTTPGTAGTDPTMGYSGGGTFKNQEEKDWYDNQIKQRIDSGMSQEEAIQDYRDTFKIGEKNVVLDEGKPATPGDSQTSEVKLKTKVEGTSMTPENLRRQIRKGKIAANQEKRAIAQAARTQAKLDKLEEAGDTSSPKYKRLQAKLKQKNQIASLASEAGKNVMRQTEEGKALEQTYIKGQRDMMQAEVDDQSTLGARTSGPNASKKFFGGSGANLSSDLGVDTSLSGAIKTALKFSPAKFKSYSKTSPMKKLTDLSGDGKVTKKDVLIGRGVINKDGSPAKYGNKKSPYKMKGYGSKTY